MSVKILPNKSETKRITDISGASSFYNKQVTVKINSSNPNSVVIDKSISTKIYAKSPHIKLEQKLPFRVRFTNVQIPGEFGIPPIGIAVIGFNNYIL